MIQPPMQSPQNKNLMTVPKPYSTPTEHEYTALEVMNITGWGQPKISNLCLEGKITGTRKGYYSRELVDAYQRDREERLAMSKPDWIIQGETP